MNPANDDTAPRPQAAERGFAFSKGVAFVLAALGLSIISVLAATGLTRMLRTPNPESPPSSGITIPSRLFRGWNQPDFVVVLSAQQHGYVLPCGCSFPQIGGLERRYNFLQALKERGWPVTAVDLGDIAQKEGPAKLPNVQGLIKYRYSMLALKEMRYLAAGIGEFESALGGWGKAEGEWALNETMPAVLVANLAAPGNFPGFKPLEIGTVAGTNFKVGVTSIVGPTAAKKIKDPNVQLLLGAAGANRGWAQVLQQQWQAMQEQKVDLPILLYHGWATPRADGKREAVLCAQAFPQFPVMLCLSEEDEPPADPTIVEHKNGTKSYLVRLGHKGKFIGVLGAWRTGKANPAFTFKYQLVKMDIDYVTPPDRAQNHPIQRLMEDYTRELQRDNYLKRYGQRRHPLQVMDAVPNLRNPENGVPTYVGSKRCGGCHPHAYEVWEASDHSHAYKTLVDAKHPSRREYDGECIVCHTIGFGYQSGFRDAVQTPTLKNVGCESCHGPGSLHAKNPENEEWKARMNQLWRGKKDRNRAIEQLCVTCHDIDNDVTWQHDDKHDPFKEKWAKIIHTTPRD